MENFNWTKISRKIAVKAPLQTIYNAWTKPLEYEKWFLKKAQFFEANDNAIPMNAVIKAGQRYEWNWFFYDETEKGEVLETNGTDLIRFTFAQGCIVTVQLSTFEEHTIIHLTQTNIPTDDKSKEQIRIGCDFGWYFYLVNIKSIYQGGLDLRNKEVDMKELVC